ncbi:hypothetical protein D3C72_1676740 [compost metagenome]
MVVGVLVVEENTDRIVVELRQRCFENVVRPGGRTFADKDQLVAGGIALIKKCCLRCREASASGRAREDRPLQEEVSGVAVGSADIGCPAIGIAVVERLDQQGAIAADNHVNGIAGLDAVEIGRGQCQLVLAELELGPGLLAFGHHVAVFVGPYPALDACRQQRLGAGKRDIGG